MKRIFLTLLLLISLISSTEASTPLTLNAGKNQSIKLGEFIVLNGKIKSGDRSQIEYYQWIENGKVLKNMIGDEILYNDAIYAENDYKPTTAGNHLLYFQAVTHSGKVYSDTLLLEVKGKNDNNFVVDAGSDKSIKLGEFIVLNGKIKSGDKSKIEYYQWTENGKTLKNALAEEILYDNVIYAENDYKPAIAGNHILQFEVIGFNGKVYSDTLTLTVKGQATGGGSNPITRQELIRMIKADEDVTKVNTSEITDMSSLFKGKTRFNQDISAWDVSNVTNMSYLFSGLAYFNQPIGSWDVSKVTNMSGMFNAYKMYRSRLSMFNQDLSQWDVSNVTNMSSMFNGAKRFNQDISQWDVSKVTTMSKMFYQSKFNQPIGNWDVSNVIDMSWLFYPGSAHPRGWLLSAPFNQDLSNWDVSKVTNMEGMFAGANHFNYPLNNWDVSNVTNMSYLFKATSSFNQPLDKWNVSNVTNMSRMFEGSAYTFLNYGAGTYKYYPYAFNQDISSWNLNSIITYLPIFIGVPNMLEEYKPEKFK